MCFDLVIAWRHFFIGGGGQEVRHRFVAQYIPLRYFVTEFKDPGCFTLRSSREMSS